MIKTIQASGKTEDEAIASALSQLGLTRDDVSVEILERARSGFLGIGSSPAVVQLTYNAPDDKTAQVRTFLTGLLERMGVEITLDITESEGVINVVMNGENPGAVIGRRGETLDAVQHLTNYAVNRSGEDRVRVYIDAENYRERRNETLENLAHKVAGKVVKYRRNMTLDPMNAYERHVIHTALQENKSVSTYSIGSEPHRRVVVAFGDETNREPRQFKRR